jgi:outer membrane autotransporter protein
MHDRVARGRHAARLAALLSTTGLTSSLGAAAAAMLIAGWALPARADGGKSGNGDAGGSDVSVGTGGAGASNAIGGGGGGGAGETGGQGGNGNVGADGGSGGTAPGGNGQPGGNAGTGGGGGGGGGAHGQVVSGAGTLGSATGGTGGAGGSGFNGGGGGGAGGWGTSVISAGSFTNAGTLTGGQGGNGGNGTLGVGNGGSGGSGGLGLFFSGGVTSLVNSGTIAGGNGGLAGSGGNFPPGPPTPGAGGTGIVGGAGGFTIVNSGTISGGLGGDGVTRANAITFAGGGTNSLTLQAGSNIIGNVVAFFGGSDVLALGGSANATFDVSQIGPAAQYQNFANYQKTGTSTWTLTGTTASTTAWALNGGTLAISADNNLGAGSGIPTFNGGTLQFNAALASTRTFQLNAAGGTFNTNGNAVTLSGSIGGPGALTKIGAGTLTLSGNGDYLGGTNINGGTLALATAGALGGGTLAFNGGTLQTNSSMTLSRATTLNAGGGTIDTNGNGLFLSSAISGAGSLTKNGAGVLDLAAANTYSGGTTVNAGTLLLDSVGGSLAPAGALTVNGGTFDMSQINGGTPGSSMTVGALAGAGGIISLGTNTLITNSSANTTLASQITGTGGLTKQGGGILTLAGSNTYSGATTVSGGLINFSSLGNFGTGTIILNGGGVQWAAGNTLDISSSPRLVLGPAGATFDTNGNNVSFATPLGGTAAITKAGNGILTFATNNNYSGGTTVTGGLINFASAGSFGSGLITLNGGGLQWAAGSTADISSKLAPLGAGGGVFDTNGNTVTFATGLTGTGGLAKQGLGTLNLTGNNTYTGGTAVLAGTLAVNGSIAGNVAVGPAGTLGGNGTIAGSVVNTGTLAPGNSIGLLTVNGSYTQTAGSTYQVEVNNAGQGDRINVGGAAAIQGGTVQVLAAAGSYGNSTTYTILRANGGVAGTYSAVSSNFAFLTPTLSYDANDVFLTLALGQNAFISFSGITPNQKAVGTALNQSFANAAGDFATVIGVLAGLNTQQGPAALDAISGQPYADFGTMNTNNAALFMNALGQQMANARGSSASPGQRQAMAQACEIESCDGTGPLSAWASALGGLGSVLGDGNASTLTYNFGGAAAGMDYRFDPRFLAGIGVGYTHGTQWVNSFMGQGWSDSVSVAAYGSFTQSGFYVDALAGYAYYGNQLQRQILIPGLQQRTATGSTGANQFLGQIEGGYKLGIYAPAAATITPFGRFQISSVTQNAFNESGAQSLNLNVAQQTTNSQRTTIGADLGSSIGFGEDKKVDFAVRLGWLHEFANVARPITAAFAGAPGNSFTVFGATPLRNSAVVGLQATTHIAAATQIYLRYDGEIASGTDNHALNIGVRMSW